MNYDHTQTAPLYLILVAAGVLALAGAWFTPVGGVQIVLACSAGMLLVLAASFRELTVRDEGEYLLLQFGPLPLFRRRLAYSEMEHVKRGRTTVLEGWGIHGIPRVGWTWNLWGFDCVEVRLRRGQRVRIGTDDPEALEAFLRERTGARDDGGECAARLRVDG